MKILKYILPGLLVAATGVGAGDLITGALAGHHLGALIWVPLLGAFLKYILTEGLARYQFAQGEPLIHGWILRLHPFIKWPFFIYLLIWSYMVGGALINATGNSLNTLIPLTHGKFIYGPLLSLTAIALILPGNFGLFEKIMGVLVGIMFITVIGTTLTFFTTWDIITTGLTSFSFKKFIDPWFLGVLGGVGGTLTIVCYGYWIRESDRSGLEGLKITRFDLVVSYVLTGLFSICMMILGTHLSLIEKGGDSFIFQMSHLFSQKLGPIGSLIFRLGFFAGVFSSLLGVWQSVPYLYADIISLHKGIQYDDLKKSKPYRIYLLFIGIVPLSSLFIKFQSIQLLYAVLGAMFIPLCSLSLLFLNNRKETPTVYKNKRYENLLLVLVFIFFGFLGLRSIF